MSWKLLTCLGISFHYHSTLSKRIEGQQKESGKCKSAAHYRLLPEAYRGFLKAKIGFTNQQYSQYSTNFELAAYHRLPSTPLSQTHLSILNSLELLALSMTWHPHTNLRKNSGSGGLMFFHVPLAKLRQV